MAISKKKTAKVLIEIDSISVDIPKTTIKGKSVLDITIQLEAFLLNCISDAKMNIL